MFTVNTYKSVNRTRCVKYSCCPLYQLHPYIIIIWNTDYWSLFSILTPPHGVLCLWVTTGSILVWLKLIYHKNIVPYACLNDLWIDRWTKGQIKVYCKYKFRMKLPSKTHITDLYILQLSSSVPLPVLAFPALGNPTSVPQMLFSLPPSQSNCSLQKAAMETRYNGWKFHFYEKLEIIHVHVYTALHSTNFSKFARFSTSEYFIANINLALAAGLLQRELICVLWQ